MFRMSLSVVVFLAACGSVSVLDGSLPPVPTITAFTADPDSFDAGGGQSLLSWTVVNEDLLELNPGGSNVTGFTSAKVTATATTTYTLTASNSLGQASSSVTLSVGP
jgi:hypothetical protein